MLVLSRKVGEQIVIGDGIVLTVTRVSNNRVTLGIQAPDSVRVLRSELSPVATEDAPVRELCGRHASLSC